MRSAARHSEPRPAVVATRPAPAAPAPGIESIRRLPEQAVGFRHYVAEMEDVVSDELIEVTQELTLSRESAAARLRQLADQLARHNQVEFIREGIRYTVEVPDEVTLKIEIEIGDESEIEFELTW
jgi:amphi-Trp domain-containing protein